METNVKNLENFGKLKVSDLKTILKLVTTDGDESRNIKDLYTGDLLSWVMGYVRGEDVVLFTVLNTVNLIAVATLLDLSAIVFCEGVYPNQEVIDKANEEGVCLFVSNDTTFHTALKVSKLCK